MATTYDLKWIPDEEPNKDGQRREWPMAIYVGPFMKHAAYIMSSKDEPYSKERMRSGNHAPLKVIIISYKDRSRTQGRRMQSDFEYKTVLDAIQYVEGFLKNHPDWHPTLI